MLTLLAGQPESLWDEALPVEARELPVGLPALDRLLSDPGLLAPIVAHWQREVQGDAPGGVDGWAADDRDGDVRAVDGLEAALPLGVGDAGGGGVGLDSSASVLPDRVVGAGAGRVDGQEADPADRAGDGGRVDACAIANATREKRFRVRAVRIDSTVIEADVKYPTDSGLAAQGVRSLAREGKNSARSSGSRSGGCGIVRGRWGPGWAR